MDRRLFIGSVAAISVVLAGGPVWGDLRPFSTEVSFISTSNPNGQLVTRTSSYTYEQSIDSPTVVNLSAGDRVTDATLTLTFYDNEDDQPNSDKHNKNEFVTVRVATDLAFSSSVSTSLGDVDTQSRVLSYTGQDLTNYIAWLNDDGKLGVKIQLDFDNQDVYLTSSEISGYFTPAAPPVVPVPGSVLLGFVGLTAAGLKLRKLV